MTVLWAMSLWAGMMVLVVSGYGAGEFRMFGMKNGNIAVAGLAVWVLGWWTSRWEAIRLTLNLGFAALTLTAVVGILLMGRMRWWVLGLWLSLFATIIRLIVPFGLPEATVIPVAVLESLGMGMAAGIAVARPFPAAGLAAATEGLASIGFGLYRPYHDLGRYDLAATILATLSGWFMAWLVAAVGQRIGRSA